MSEYLRRRLAAKVERFEWLLAFDSAPMRGRGCCAVCFSPYMCALSRSCGCHIELGLGCRSCGAPLYALDYWEG